MQRASDLFIEEQRKQVEKAVVEAEAKTSCEIVPVVATASGRYDRPEDMIGLWLAILAANTVWLIFPRQSHESGSWDGLPTYVGLFALVVGIVVAFIAGVLAGSRIGWLRRLFTPREEMLEAMRSVLANPQIGMSPEAVQTVLEIDKFIINAHFSPVITEQDECLGIVTVLRDHASAAVYVSDPR